MATEAAMQVHNIYEESCGVMKIFVEVVVKDAIIYETHYNRKTVTAMDVIYALKCLRRMLYGFTCPYFYSRKLELKPSEHHLTRNCLIPSPSLNRRSESWM